jgi:hypothetical protein
VAVIHKLINIIWNKEELPDQRKESIIVPIHKKVLKLPVIIIMGYQSYQFHTKCCRISFFQEFGIPMKLVRLIKMCLNETYSKTHLGKHLSYSFPIQNGFRQGDTLSPLLFNFTLEYAIRRVQENQVRLKLNGTHQILAYADDVNLLEDNIYIINKNTVTLIYASKEVGLEVNVEKTKYMLVSFYQKSEKENSEQII